MGILRWLAVCCLVLVPIAAQADGAAFKATQDWPRIGENAQYGLVHWADGRQRMALGVRLDMLSGDTGVWLVPVRGSAATVHVGLAPDLPWIRGGISDPHRKARERFDTSLVWIAGVGAPGAPLSSILLSGILIPSLLESRVSSGDGFGETVHRDGLAATVLQATDLADLARLLADLGRPVPKERLATFAPYCDGGHSVVAVRLDGSDRQERTRVPVLLVDFPTPEPWFPMRASAGAGQTRVLLTLEGWRRLDGSEARVTPAARMYWGGREGEGWRETVTWLGWRPDQRPTRLTFVAWHGDDFSRDWSFTPDTRPELENGMGVLAVKDGTWALGVWGVILLSGIAGGAIAGRILLRREGWGAKAGISFAVLGFLGMWLVARWWANARILPVHAWPARRTPLDVFPMLLTAVLALLLGMLVGMLSFPLGMGAAVMVIAGLHGLVWTWWGLMRAPEGRLLPRRHAAIRRRAAWAYAAPSFAVVVGALLLTLIRECAGV